MHQFLQTLGFLSNFHVKASIPTIEKGLLECPPTQAAKTALLLQPSKNRSAHSSTIRVIARKRISSCALLRSRENGQECSAKIPNKHRALPLFFPVNPIPLQPVVIILRTKPNEGKVLARWQSYPLKMMIASTKETPKKNRNKTDTEHEFMSRAREISIFISARRSWDLCHIKKLWSRRRSLTEAR